MKERGRTKEGGKMWSEEGRKTERKERKKRARKDEGGRNEDSKKRQIKEER